MNERLAEDLIQEMRKAGCRITRARRAVVQVVAQSAQTLKPAEIMTQARVVYPSVNLATVYRTLEALQATRCTRRVRLGSDAPVVVACHQTGLHAHLICRQCRQVQECNFGVLTKKIETLIQITGFAPQSNVIEMVGLCKACQR